MHFRLATPLTLLRTSPTLLKVNHSHAFSSAARRLAASEVSGKPASENLSHMTTNAKEEAGAVAHTIAKGIAGTGGKGDYDPASITRTTDGQSHGKSEPLRESFVSLPLDLEFWAHIDALYTAAQGNLTSTIASTVPKHILVFGLAGGLPYLGASLTTLYVARQASQAASGLTSTVDIQSAIALLDSCSHIQVTYGAVMLSFLGAIHWGFEFAKYGGYQGYSRLVLGVAPLLAAWPTLTMEPQLALVAQWFIFTSLVRSSFPFSSVLECSQPTEHSLMCEISVVRRYESHHSRLGTRLVLAIPLLPLHPRGHLHPQHTLRSQLPRPNDRLDARKQP